MRPIVIVQARFGSTRLPGKVLAEVGGRPVLIHVLQRAAAIEPRARVVLATTEAAADDATAAAAERAGFAVFRGSEDDVLDRYYQAWRRFGGDPVVRVTADCPLLDPSVSRRVLDRVLRGDVEYASNLRPNSYPDGLDTEVATGAALECAWGEAERRADRENVMPYIWLRPERFRIANVVGERDLSERRWTVDEPEDLAFVRAVFSGLRRRGWQGHDHQEVLHVVEEDGLRDA
ncbi:MAG: cytidylyltransferase domain-containing protein, partial [Methanobacteriota archaeon]